ncbi:MAG: threonine synthase [Candidatus Limnocylindrales bacterium]|nr:threonine synthase [Candidatus Limnocylindrales bacterium]
MTTELLGEPLATNAGPPDAAGRPAAEADAQADRRILGLRCRACGRPEPLGPSYVCAGCFGPLEVAYDLDVVRSVLSRATIEARPAGIWRYLELLPVANRPARGLPVGSSPLLAAERLGAAIGIERLLIKDDSRNPTLSFKDRAVAVAVARAVDFGMDALACASTGNLAGATAAAAAVVGLPAYVFVPADLEPAKIDHALAYGATVVPVQGTYDDVNRLCLEIADERGWGFVNINLRPFYAEGSKTLAFEIAEGLGWRLPDVVVAPIASGALFTKLARGFDELAAIGLVERTPVRFVGGKAAGCSPVAGAFGSGSDIVEPVRTPDTIVRSLAIGNPADGRQAVELARSSEGSIEAIPDDATAEAIRRAARLEGIYPETAGGVTIAAAEAARRRGIIRPGDEVVALLTGNGLKTPDAFRFGVEARLAERGVPGLAAAIPASYRAFEAWLDR